MAVEYLLQGDGVSKIKLGDGSGFLLLGTSGAADVTPSGMETTTTWANLMRDQRLAEKAMEEASLAALDPIAAYHEARRRG